MLSVPSVERRGDIHSAVHKSGVQRQREGKVPKRNVAKRKCECERIESAGGQAAKKYQQNQQTVAVRHPHADGQDSEKGSSGKQDSTRAQKTAEVNSERTYKHQPRIEGTADPRAFIVPKAV